jgi:hypothetical protein
MFPTDIRTSSGKLVDFDRALPLMDRDLLSEALRVLMRESVRDWDDFDRATAKRALGIDELSSRLSTVYWRAQLVWDEYCELHEEKYGSPFTPDADPHWDSS